MPSRYEMVSLDEISVGATDYARPRGYKILLAALAMILIPALIGAGFAAMATPAVLAASSTTEKVTDYWEAFPSDLPIAAALPQHVVLLDKSGAEFARFYNENRIPITYEQISPNFINALVATEDSRFYQHSGVDFAGIARAMVKNLTNDNRTEGASTITQQLVQNILISNARNDDEREVAKGDTYESKIREVKYAVALEKTMPKQDILSTYSNAVYFGNLAYGVEAASRVYFSSDAASLTVPQAAVLVGLLQSPVQYDPYARPEASQARRDAVIDRMLAEGYITAEEAAAATATPLTLSRGDTPSGCATSAYPYYCALVQQELLANVAFGATPEERQQNLSLGGITVTTALDRGVSDAATRAATDALGNDNRVAAGIAVVVPGTGHIAAVAENRGWNQTQVVYATSAQQPGSVMKPLTLVTALEQGIPITTTLSANGPYFSRVLDSPKKGYTNFGNAQLGNIDARSAIRQSVNIYFVKLIEQTTVMSVVDMSRRLGISTINTNEGDPAAVGPRTGSFALGTSSVTPVEMANVYATFAAGGVKCNPISIVSAVRTTTGEPLPTSAPECHQEISPAIAAQMTDALQGTFGGGGTLAGVGPLPGRETAGKTGTTDDSSANWTVGMTPNFATAVWVGDPRGGFAYPLTSVFAYGRTFFKTTGSAIAGRIWKTVMVDVHQGQPVTGFPNG
ncbi:PBP1A family penicillin-binding protein [Conyzicola nivalis]|uniref:Penicillin-binding protein n=1 Tax=Conyzicola nivalis TaxID=1477021 RepID=A0A916SN96_9MICO|nr:transglycosylase domain-containing protein [Conyzicola nivalis]GGB08515.1 penicillin-binding protein [Conyzicola nivalis]